MNILNNEAALMNALMAADMDQYLDIGTKAMAYTVRHLQCMELGAWLQRAGMNDEDGSNMTYVADALMQGKLDSYIYGEE